MSPFPKRRPGQELGGARFETLAGDSPSAPEPGSETLGSDGPTFLGRMPCFNWLCRKKSTWRDLLDQFGRAGSMVQRSFQPHHTPSHCFHPGRNLGSELSARHDFQNAQKEHRISQIESCLAFDCNGADIKGHPLQVCPYLGHLPGGGVLLQRNWPLV